jgi:hyperosmotically inducible protein
MQNPQRKSHLIFALLMAALLALPIFGFISPARGGEATLSGCIDPISLDRWKSGLIEGAITFNDHLYEYELEITVTQNTAMLSGIVANETERQLAEQIALSIYGIDSVENNLVIGTLSANTSYGGIHYEDRSQIHSDAIVTTKVKSQLLANKETNSLEINVDTNDRVVTLTGQVRNDIEKELAYYITRNTGGVRHVVNKLEIEPRV